MTTINVNAEHTYSVKITDSWQSELVSNMQGRTRVAVIISEGYAPDLTEVKNVDSEVHVFEVPDGEEAKSVITLHTLWNWLGAAGFTRSDLIVGIGGGAITDLAGFAAASWLRGLDWIAVPTSLAGMVDASVGGKTGINSDYGKNLIGMTHMDGAKVSDLPLLMAHEASLHWAYCPHRYIYGHHVHHKTSKDYMSVCVETLRSPSGTDSWHHRNGYQFAPKAIEAFLHHKEHGQVARLTHLF